MRALPVLSLVLLTACLIPTQGANTAPSTGYAASDPYAGSSTGGGGSAGADGTPGYASSAGGATGMTGNDGAAGHAPPAGPTTVSVTIRSACSKTVPVFYGDKPKYGSGTTSSVSSNSVSSKTFQVGDQMWVLDDSGNGAGSVTISETTRNIEINSSCGGLSAR